MIFLVLGCHFAAPPGTGVPGDPATPFAAADLEATRLVRDPARGGAPLPGDASPLPPFRGVDRATARYVGPTACGACHSAAATTWSTSAHSRAFAALVERQRANDPRCFRCHVTGYGSAGGYASGAAPEGAAAVGCEACHGPGSDHLAAGREAAAQYGELPASAAACTACHTWENSPDFSWADYWPQIAHGG